jgi:hypothetical protein
MKSRPPAPHFHTSLIGYDQSSVERGSVSSGVFPISRPICHDAPAAQEVQLDYRVAGEEALARCDWAHAKTSFDAALAVDAHDPHARDGLLALFWLGKTRAARECRERAYVEHRRRGDARRAANAAIFVSSDYRISGENAAAARGWLARAERCLEGIAAADPQPDAVMDSVADLPPSSNRP